MNLLELKEKKSFMFMCLFFLYKKNRMKIHISSSRKVIKRLTPQMLALLAQIEEGKRLEYLMFKLKKYLTFKQILNYIISLLASEIITTLFLFLYSLLFLEWNDDDNAVRLSLEAHFGSGYFRFYYLGYLCVFLKLFWLLMKIMS
jgi:hypothetical protein